MNPRLRGSAFIVLLAALSIVEGMGVRGIGMEPRCRCIKTESRRIGSYIQKVELFPPSPQCEDTEIIATMKRSGREICLEPTAPWVKKVIEKILANNEP
ncbi:interleukin-8-like [Scleropages formosus]|uniref:Chemokine (C-X-C motif) ligand 8a n=1 Tax=Scleropages formosus TaxID=113540 RepID=A0A8C9VED5_SCLFO|nr:interleukin-8-like [Scleropages formosus]